MIQSLGLGRAERIQPAMFGEIVLTLWPVIGGVKSKTRHWASYSAA